MATQVKTMQVKSDVALAETTTKLTDSVTFDVSKLPNGITYKGLKAVLSFADPIEWNKESTYDALTVVWDKTTLASYASKRAVPTGIEITNDKYWLRMADGDAQIEIYRQEVAEFDDRITENTTGLANEITRATTKEDNITDSLKHKVIIFGDSWAADSPGIGIGQMVYDNLLWDKQLVGNYAVSGAQFGNSSMTTTTNNTSAQLDSAENSLTEDIRKSVTDVIIIAGVNNVGTAQLQIDAVSSHFNRFQTDYPNAIVHMLYSSPRSFYNEHMSGNICNRIYAPLQSGAVHAGVKVYRNSLTWLKTSNEDIYWDSTSNWYSVHPNDDGRKAFAKTAATAIMSGGDIETYTLVDYTWGDNVTTGNSYLECILNGTTMTIKGYITPSTTLSPNTETVMFQIPKLCFLSPVTYNRAPLCGNGNTVTGFMHFDGVGRCSVRIGDVSPTGFIAFTYVYEII